VPLPSPHMPYTMPRMALVLNLGSASLKAACYALVDGGGDGHPILKETCRTAADADAGTDGDEDRAKALLAHVTARMPSLRAAPEFVAHRIVHGGDRPEPAVLTAYTLAQLQELAPLAPLHQPPALALVRAAMDRWPDAIQLGVFDTSWHRTMPQQHRLLPLPFALHARGIKRYGFHGLAFQAAMRQIGRVAPELSKGRIVLAHLGGGSSLCAVRDGRSVSTTMGMTPLGGLPMATRCGSLDPGVLLHLQRTLGMSPERIDELLWRESGLRGVSDESGDMRALLASPTEGARRAVDLYVSAIAQGIAAMAACIGGIDLLAFSGGIGAHAGQIRARVTGELAWLGISVDAPSNAAGNERISGHASSVEVLVLAVDEAAEMAEAVAGLTVQSGTR